MSSTAERMNSLFIGTSPTREGSACSPVWLIFAATLLVALIFIMVD